MEDHYRVPETGVFAVDRKVSVLSVQGDAGFRSRYSLALCNPEESIAPEQYDFFMPSILYKDTDKMRGGSIGANLDVSRLYVTETKTGLPLAMLRSKAQKYSIAIAHLNPEIDVNGIVGGGKVGDINADLQYGSIGYRILEGPSVEFNYPAEETTNPSYDPKKAKGIYHPVTVGQSHEYSLSIIPTKEENYEESMIYTYHKAYMAESPEIAYEVDLEAVYDDNMELFMDTYKEFGTGDVISAGVPFYIQLISGTPIKYSFQIGFAGEQPSIGYHLLREGYANGDEEMIRRGNVMIDFWTSDSIMCGALPIVWWIPRDSETAGAWQGGYQAYLRMVADGMEGILDAYKVAYENGVDKEQWKNALIKVADFFADHQNEDGSYYRLYYWRTGKPGFPYGEEVSDSPLNTPMIIRFLAKMYEFTGDERYKTAALRAADYSYEVLYKELGKYLGGCPDNPNVIDKEAAMYAMYGFNAAYMLSGEEKYLAAAEHAATSAMSWVYCYDFACPSSPGTDQINPFKEGGRISGWSTVANGHFATDSCAASMYYEMFKLYAFTGNEFYLEAAKLLGFNTKQSSDYDGSLNWKYRALVPEASTICDFNFRTVGNWVTWISIANIKPIGYMEDTFGSSDIRELNLDPEALRSQLDAYGIGGKLPQK